MMLGNTITEHLEDLVLPTKNNVDEEWTSDKEESITQLVRHTELSLLQPNEECYGGWALVDPYTLYVVVSFYIYQPICVSSHFVRKILEV